MSVRYIFVGGCARSGTTLLQKMLMSHSSIAGGCEFMHLPLLMNARSKMILPYHLERQDIYYDKEVLDENFRGFVDSFFHQLRNSKPGLEFVSEKTPNNIYCVRDLLQLYPDCLVILIKRDGRDVITSLRDVSKRNLAAGGKEITSVMKSAKSWNECIWIENELKNSEYSDRVYSLKYEDLVEDPVAVIPPLMEFLGLDVQKNQYNPENVKRSDLGNRETGDVWYSDKMYDQKLSKGKVNRWKHSLPFFAKVKAQLLIAHNLKQEGYSISPVYLVCGQLIRWFKKLLSGS